MAIKLYKTVETRGVIGHLRRGCEGHVKAELAYCESGLLAHGNGLESFKQLCSTKFLTRPHWLLTG